MGKICTRDRVAIGIFLLGFACAAGLLTYFMIASDGNGEVRLRLERTGSAMNTGRESGFSSVKNFTTPLSVPDYFIDENRPPRGATIRVGASDSD